MKYCHYGFEYLYLDNYLGDVYICPWMEPEVCKIGNLLEKSLDEIWHGEIAENFRNMFRENCFKHCRSQACPHLQNNDLPEITDMDEYKRLTKTPDKPKFINLAYDFVCNQSCETCRTRVFIPPQGYKERMEIIREKIAPYLDTAQQISMSGHGDPFASPYMMDILENMHPENKNFALLIETNGVFFDEEHWERIKHLKDVNINITVTTNSFDEFTYNHISRGGNFNKLMHNLKFISELRKKGDIKNFTNVLVVQDRNFREIPSFINKTFNEYAVDNILLRPVYQWGTMNAEVFWFKDVLNPKHPYHQEYLEIMQHPSLKDPRVYNFGGGTEHPSVDYPIKPMIDQNALNDLKKLAEDFKKAAGLKN